MRVKSKYRLLGKAGLAGLLVLLCFAARAQNVHYVLKPSFQYDRISSYSEGLSRVQIGFDTTGFLNRSGKLVFTVPYNYGYVHNFHNGLARVQKETDDGYLYGYINKKGKLSIPFNFLEAKDFSDNRAVVYTLENGWEVINRKGQPVIDDSILITEMPHTNSDKMYDVEPPGFHDGLMLTRRNKKYGYANKFGKIVIPCRYDIALDFSDGAALVANEIPYKKMKGNSVIDSIYNSLPDGPLQKQWMIINKAGKVVYHFKKGEHPDWQENFSDGLVGFYNGRKKGFVNAKGEVIVPAKYGNNPYPLAYSDGVTIIQIRGQKSDNSDGYFILKDTTGKTISKIPFQTEKGLMYNSNLAYHEGLLAVKLLQKKGEMAWGYIDKQGNVVIAPQFSKALDFHDGRAVVVTHGKVGIIKNPLLGFSQTKKANCDCPKEMAGSKIDTIFRLPDGKAIALCGYTQSPKDSDLSEFALMDYQTGQRIGVWGSFSSCSIQEKGDTLVVHENKNFPVGKNYSYQYSAWTKTDIFNKKGKWIVQHRFDSGIKKYTSKQIAAVIHQYDTTPSTAKKTENVMLIAYKLFIATISGSKEARIRLLNFDKKYGELDGAWAEGYDDLMGMLKSWEDKKIHYPAE